MFDTYVTKRDTQFVTKDIREYKAPTDESVRLLREIEQKAKDEILKSLRLDNNDFKGVIHYMKNALTGDHHFVISFDFNGLRIQHSSKISEWKTTDELLEILRLELARTIAGNVLSKVFTNDLYYQIFK